MVSQGEESEDFLPASLTLLTTAAPRTAPALCTKELFMKEREQREAGEESKEDGKLMGRLDAGRADGMIGSEG